MSKLNFILEAYPDEDLLKADGFDDAVIGISDDFNSDLRLVYSINKSIKILIENGMTESDAEEYFYYNVSGAYVGPKTPIWCNDDF